MLPEKILNKISAFLASRHFFYLTVALFVLEAGYLALYNSFPMAYDEAYHLGIIALFSHHINPIITSQPPTSYQLGAIIHSPSFLYYYFLSFPYRLITHITGSFRLLLLSLRFLNIAFAVGTLVMTRKILKLLGLNKAMSNVVLLFFALTPIFTVLSAAINYENLMFFLGSACVYYFLLSVLSLRQGRPSARLSVWVLALAAMTSMADYEFLPILCAIVVFLAFEALKPRTSLAVRLHLKSRSRRQALGDICLVLFAGLTVLLFAASYGYDLVKYRTPDPQCDQVLTVKDCEQYYSWDRNYLDSLHDPFSHKVTPLSMAHYSYIWFGQMRTQLFGALSPTGVSVQASPFLKWPIIAATVTGVLGCLLCAKDILNKHSLLIPLGFIIFVYISILWAREYYYYKLLGQAVSIQGRFLLLVLAYIYSVLALGIYYLFKKINFSAGLNTSLATLLIIIVCLLGGSTLYAKDITPYYRYPWPNQAPPLRTP